MFIIFDDENYVCIENYKELVIEVFIMSLKVDKKATLGNTFMLRHYINGFNDVDKYELIKHINNDIKGVIKRLRKVQYNRKVDNG